VEVLSARRQRPTRHVDEVLGARAGQVDASGRALDRCRVDEFLGHFGDVDRLHKQRRNDCGVGSPGPTDHHGSEVMEGCRLDNHVIRRLLGDQFLLQPLSGVMCVPADPVDSQDGEENVSPNTRLSAGGDKPAGDGAEESPGAFGVRAGRVCHVDDGVYVI
jgi:hypothetical protein